MKREGNLYSDLYNIDNIIKMTDKVLSKVKNKERREKFLLYYSEHIISIKKRLESSDINLGKYNIFLITDPKCRVIMSQSIEDKVINHLIAEYLLVRVFDTRYIDSMCATRINKGSGYATKLMKKYLNEIKLKHNRFYILKLDIKKYFYNIDHNILKRILKDNIKDKKAINLLFKVIDSTNDTYINEQIIKLKENRIKNLSNEKLILETRKIPLYKYDKGCGIGDQTSQAFGLIYLNEICHFIKEELHIKYFINYMDDFIIIHYDKEYLEYCLDIIKDKLLNDYKLELNRKTRIYNINEGIEFLGYRYILKNNKVIIKLRNITKKNFKKNVKMLNLLKKYNYIDNEKYKLLLNGYKGVLSKGNCNNLFRSVIHD
ncbi:MAG: RNA-directed DNA polymerase [Bacilli bacterium]